MANKNKDKGKRIEREICDILKEATNLSWTRVPNSGSFLGSSNVYRAEYMSENQIELARGDIIPPMEFSGSIIECKGRKDFQFHNLFIQNKELDSWIDQCLVDYEKTDGKFFAVIFKINRKGVFIVTKENQINSKDENRLIYSHKDELYQITKFDVEWIKKHKVEILNLCNR